MKSYHDCLRGQRARVRVREARSRCRNCQSLWCMKAFSFMLQTKSTVAWHWLKSGIWPFKNQLFRESKQDVKVSCQEWVPLQVRNRVKVSRMKLRRAKWKKLQWRWLLTITTSNSIQRKFTKINCKNWLVKLSNYARASQWEYWPVPQTSKPTFAGRRVKIGGKSAAKKLKRLK